MQKRFYPIFSAIIPLAALLLSACSQNEDKLATAEFVDAANRTVQAKTLLQNCDFAASKKAFENIDAKLRDIAVKYPSSAVALKLVSVPDIRAGEFKFRDIRGKILPALALATSPETAKISRSCAIAVFCDTPRDAFETLAELVNKTDKFDAKTKAEIIAKLPIDAKIQASPNATAKTSIPAAASANTRPALTQAEAKTLLAEASRNAKFCASSLSAAESLLEKSQKIDAAHRAEFTEILKLALDRAGTISVVSMREKSFAILAAAAAKAGLEQLALDTIARIKDYNSFENVFGQIAESIGKTKNYPAALSIASKIRDAQKRDAFIAVLAANIARQNKFETATQIAKQIADIKTRNDTFVEIAILAYDAREYKLFAAVLTNIDISDLSCLKKFATFAAPAETDLSISNSAAILAELTIPVNAKIAEYLNNTAAEKYSGGVACATRIVDNYSKLGDYPAALNFVHKNERLIGTKTFHLSTRASINALEADNADAEKALVEASTKAAFKDTPQKIEFAFLLETSKISEQTKSKILSHLLKAELR